MSDPIALHSKPLSNPLDSSAINQPAAAGQFQQFSTQPHDSSNQMPDRTDDTGKRSSLPERNIRQPVKDEFLSDQEAMTKASRQLLAKNQQSLQTHKDRLNSLGIDSQARLSHQPTLANAAKSPPETGRHDAITSDQAVSVNTEVVVTERTEQDSITETGVSSAKSDSAQRKGDIKSGTIRITARTCSTDDKGPDTKVTTTSIVTKTVTTTTTETLHDQLATPTLRATIGERTDSLKTLPGLGEITPAVGHFSEPLSRRTSIDTANQESLSSNESAEFQIASSIIIDPDTVLSPKRSREIILAHGEKQKVYKRANVPENSTVRDLQEQIESLVTGFRKDKKRAKLLVEISSCRRKENGKEESTLYASYEGVRQGLGIKRQPRPAAAEIARQLSSRLVEKEMRADEKIDQLQNGLPKDEKPVDGQNEQTVEGQIKGEQSKVEQSKVEQGKVEQGKVEQSKVEQSKVEQSKVEQSKNEQSKNEQTRDAQDNSDQPS